MHRVLATGALCLALACGGADDLATGPGPTPGPGGGACMGEDLLASLGKARLLVGLSGSDAAAAAAPYDVRYLYIAGGISPGVEPCGSCSNACGSWWGCWQDWSSAPGTYATSFVSAARLGGQIPMFTYYELLQSMSPPAEGDAEVKQVADAAFMSRYYADWRFLLTQIGGDLAFLHVEPDFWGFAAQRGVACSAIPAAVASANPVDCGDLPNTLAGMGQCMIAMARKHAPHAKVGLHASGWGTRLDVLMNVSRSLDVAAQAKDLGDFLVGCGAGAGDFIVADMSDRDAGTNGKWWDPTNATLPDFHQAFTWGGAVAEAVGLPLLWWQVPVGNMSLAPANQDNRVDYVLGHMSELAASHAFGVAFGAGADGQATPDGDGGNLAARTAAYAAAGGVAICR